MYLEVNADRRIQFTDREPAWVSEDSVTPSEDQSEMELVRGGGATAGRAYKRRVRAPAAQMFRSADRPPSEEARTWAALLTES